MQLQWLSKVFYNLTLLTLGELKTHMLLGPASDFQYTSRKYSRWIQDELKQQDNNCVRIGAVVPPVGKEDIIIQNISPMIIPIGIVSVL